MALGIDVYTAYQNVTDWSAVRRSGVEFCYVKVSDGLTTRNTNGYGRTGHAAGVAMGAYHFAQAGDPVRQANLLCDRVAAEGLIDLRPALDAEAPGTTNAAFCIAFLRQVIARGYRPCMYASNSTFVNIGAAVDAAVPDVRRWVARYAGLTSTEKLRPSVRWDVHQFSQAGRIPGISGTVDLNDGTAPLAATTPAGKDPISMLQPSQIALTRAETKDGADKTFVTYTGHRSLMGWDQVDGMYVALGSGFAGCRFTCWIKMQDGTFVVSGDPRIEWSKDGRDLLQASLAAHDTYAFAIPKYAQSLSVRFDQLQSAEAVCSADLYTDAK